MERLDSIAKRIKQLREDAGYQSYEHFAWENKIPRVQYWRLERGSNFTMKSLFKILDAHKITLEEFFKGV